MGGNGSRTRITRQKKEDFTFVVQVKLLESVFLQGQKQQVIQKLTNRMVSVEGKSLRPANRVKVEELKSGQWGIGGKPKTTYEIMALAGESYDGF